MPRIRRLGLAVAAVPFVAALTGCSVVAAFTPHVEPAIYDTAKELQASKNASVGTTTFVPDDATVIRIDYDTQTNEAIMTYTSPTLLRPEVCKGASKTGKPSIQDSWWPVSGVPAEGSACPGGWVAFAIGQQVYAMRPATR